MFPFALNPMVRALVASGMIMAASASFCSCAGLQSSGGKTPNVTSLPDLPKASTVFADRSKVVAFHASQFQIVETMLGEVPPVVRFSTETDGKKRGYEGVVGEWIAAGDFAVRFTERSDSGESDAAPLQATFYHLPSLPDPVAESGVVVAETFQPDDFKKLQGGWIALSKANPNDATATDDDAAELQFAMGPDVESISLREFSSQRVGTRVIAVGEVVADAVDPTASTAEISVRDDGRAWSDEVERETATSSDASISFAGLDLSTAVFQRDRPFVLLSVASTLTSRDIVLAEGQGVRLGRVGIEVESISEDAVGLALIKYSTDKRPDASTEAATDPKDEAEEGDLISTRLVAGSPYSFAGARWELVRVVENERSNITDDQAQVLVRFAAGGSGTYTIREGSRDTVRGGNRWWVLSVTSAEGGRYPYADVEIEVGSFLGQQ